MDVELLVDIGCDTGECPVWSGEEQVLWWVDIPACRLFRFDPAAVENRSYELPCPCGALALRAGGGLLLALKTGLAFFDPETGDLQQVAPPPFEHPDDRFNDGRTDPRGRFWVCSMRDPQDPVAKAGAFYRIEPDLTLTTQIRGLITGNGLAFSPDARTMYQSDSHASVQTIWAWDYDLDDGRVSNRRVFVDMHDVEGRPDGAAVDADGCYWIAANTGAQLIRYTPAGRIDRQVPLPVRRPTMCCFGGRALDTIFVTTQAPRSGESRDGQPHAGGLFAVHAAGIKGLPEPSFGAPA